MFESFEEAERNRGLKGFLTRHFGPVIYADMAEEGIREISIVFMVLAALTALFGLIRYGSPWALVSGLILAAIAYVLYLTRSRAAAIALLTVSTLNALLSLPAFGPWIWVLPDPGLSSRRGRGSPGRTECRRGRADCPDGAAPAAHPAQPLQSLRR